jgi:uncharacterized protein (UPF0333 family)
MKLIIILLFLLIIIFIIYFYNIIQNTEKFNNIYPYYYNYPFSYNYYNPRPVPINTIRWNKNPMLTSIYRNDLYKNDLLGQWIKVGIAYSENLNNSYFDVYQLNLGPRSDLYNYKIINKYGQEIPIQRNNILEDGDKFQLKGIQGFVKFIDTSKYSYIYI